MQRAAEAGIITPPQGLGEQRKSPFFFRWQDLTPDFFQISQNAPRALPVHDVIHIHWSTFYPGFLF